MDDLISRQSVLNIFTYFDESERLDMIKMLPSMKRKEDEWCKDCKEYDRKKHCCPRFNRIIREALDAVEEQKTMQWTPCSEGLPNEIDDYLVTTHSGQIARYIYMDTDSSKKYWMRNVVAWMPLPKPWKGEKNG